MENPSIQERYEIQVAGLELGSAEFEQELEKLAHELAEPDSTEPAKLNVFFGNFAELAAQGYPVETIFPEKIFAAEQLVIITNKENPHEPVLTLRAVTVNSKLQSKMKEENGRKVPGKATYLLPRYEGFTAEIVADPEKFANKLLYLLGISIERFKWQDQIFHRDTFDEMEEPKRDDKDGVLDDVIRTNYLKRHDNSVLLHKSVWGNYKSTTRLLRDLIFIRLAPDYESTPEEIFEIAANPLKKLPGEVITNPNEVLEVVLRMLVITLDTIIMNNQRSQLSQLIKQTELIKEANENDPDVDKVIAKYLNLEVKLTSQISDCFQEAQILHDKLLSAEYNPSTSAHRHRLTGVEVTGFGKLYGEIAGELVKTIMLCEGGASTMVIKQGSDKSKVKKENAPPVDAKELAEPTAEEKMIKFRVKVGNQLFGDRIYKLGVAADDITTTAEAGNKMLSGISIFFRKAAQYVALSDSSEASKIVDRERKGFKHQILSLSKSLRREGHKLIEEQNAALEASLDEEKTEMNTIYGALKHALKTILQHTPIISSFFEDTTHVSRIKTSEGQWKLEIANALKGIYNLIPDLARSKRGSVYHTSILLNQIEDATHPILR